MNPRNAARVLAVLVALLTSWEGLKLVAWHDPIDPKGVNTVCFGHIEDVKVGDRYTKTQCQEMLAKDIPRYMAMVRKCIKVPMPAKREAAIISFTYNVGGGALCKSSVARHLNAGNVRAGCDALMLYNRANGKPIRGLSNRREAERKLCLSED